MIHLFLCASEIEDATARAISHNLFDFVAEHNIASRAEFEIDQITVGASMDQLLEVARTSSSKWGVFFKVGTIFKYMYMHTIREALLGTDADTALIGHVLDRGDRYYELHDQSFVVNLDKLRQLDPSIRYTPVPGVKNLMDRSEENFHGGYTPLWVSANGQQQFYDDPAPGADLVSACLTVGTVRPYNREERRNKGYVYPENQEGFINTISRIESEMAYAKSRYYMFNTDSGLGERFTYMDRISRMVTPASGFLPFEMLRDMKPTDNFKFVFYDYSDTARWMYSYILNTWNGTDIHQLYQKLPASLISGPVDPDYISQQWGQMMDRFGGQSEWLSFFTKYRRAHTIRTVDLFGDYNRPDFTETFVPHADTTLYTISNIYWYAPTAILRPYEHRMRLLNEHLAYLKQHTPDINVYFSMPGIEYGGRARDIGTIPEYSFPWRTGANLVDKPVHLL